MARINLGNRNVSAIPSRQVLLYGDSHSEAVFQAAEKRQRKGTPTPISIHRARRQKGELTLGDTSFEEFIELVTGLSESDVVVSMIGGNQHAVFSTIQHPIAFDVLEPDVGAETLRPGAQIIPHRAVWSILNKKFRSRDGRALKAIRNSTRASVVHIMSPPPKRDSAFLQQFNESHFRESIAKWGVSPPELRMKIWKMQRNLTRTFCEELGVVLLEPPAASVDPDGFLLADYQKRDVTHANRAYGLLLLDVLERQFAPEFRSIA